MTDTKTLTLRVTPDEYAQLQQDLIAYSAKVGKVIPMTAYMRIKLDIAK